MIRFQASLAPDSRPSQDGVVYNAGPLEFLPVEAFSRQLEVNVAGQLAVTQAFLPSIRKAKGRIVNIGSISGRLALPLLGPYCASKFALEALTTSLRLELAPWDIKVAIIEASGIKTPIWRKSLEVAERMLAGFPPGAEELYGDTFAAQRERATREDDTGVPVGRVARYVVHALTSPRLRYIIGRRANLGELLLRLPEPLRERIILSQVNRGR